MPTAAYWIVQRRDPANPKDAFAWVTIHDCKTGNPRTFSTQSLAMQFLKKFAATQKPALTAADIRVLRVYKVSASEVMS